MARAIRVRRMDQEANGFFVPEVVVPSNLRPFADFQPHGHSSNAEKRWLVEAAAVHLWVAEVVVVVVQVFVRLRPSWSSFGHFEVVELPLVFCLRGLPAQCSTPIGKSQHTLRGQNA